MPVTKNFSLPIEILDQILSIVKKFTYNQLLARINERLSEIGLSEISDTTLRNDIKFLRVEKDAPLFKATNAELVSQLMGYGTSIEILEYKFCDIK
jgi:hypothetical protein